MATTWTRVNQRFEYFMGDTPIAGQEPLFSVPLRIEAWNLSQRAFAHQHTPRMRQTTLSIETGGREGLLPPDFLEMDMIFDASEDRWWKPMGRAPGDIRYDDEEEILEYWTWGNRLFLESRLTETDTDLTLYYWAYWPEVEYTVSGTTITVEQEEILVPRWSMLALLHLCAAIVLNPLEIESADLSQYKIRVESGHPEHNPREQSADWHYRWYQALVAAHPKPPRRGE